MFQIKNYKIPLEFWVSYHDVVASAEKLLPTPELQHLFKYLADLIEKVRITRKYVWYK